ncbi:DUF2510 domain-containing protein [Mycolicibacterium phlei]
MTKTLEAPAGWYSDGTGGQRYWDGTTWTATLPPEAAREATELESRRRLLIRWFTVCTALMVALTATVIWTLFATQSNDIMISAPSSPAASAPYGLTPDIPTPEGEWIDGPLAFRISDIEVGTTVSSTEAPVEKTAVGQFIVVRLAVANIGGATAHFTGTLQTLHAGGSKYAIDDEASVYVNGGYVQIPPGAEALVGVAYDVPPGTVPDMIDLRADPTSPGVKVPLS